MKLKSLAVLGCVALGLCSLAFAGTNNKPNQNANPVLADDTSGPSSAPSSSDSGTTDNSNVGSSSQDTQMPPSDDSSGSSTDTGTGDDDY